MGQIVQYRFPKNSLHPSAEGHEDREQLMKGREDTLTS
jgi:hypothetical protein